MKSSTNGVGLTVIEKVIGVPEQPLAVGVTVMLAVIGAAVMLVAVNALMLPEPLGAKPIAGLSLVQLNAVAPTEPVKNSGEEATPLHNVWLKPPITSGIGLTTTLKG